MLTVTKAKPTDTMAIAALFREMDGFYGETEIESIDTKVRQINAALFDDQPFARALLAWEGTRLLGFASFSFLWPAARTTKSLYLKELYVSERHRKKGVGRLLMRRLFEVASENRCSRVEWTTDESNVDAQLFYENLEILRLPSKFFYRAEVTAP